MRTPFEDAFVAAVTREARGEMPLNMMKILRKEMKKTSVLR